MKNIFFVFAGAVLVFAFVRIESASAATPLHKVYHHCSVNRAYDSGYRDGQRRVAMQQDYARHCRKSWQKRLNSFYTKGYNAAQHVHQERH